MGERTNEQVACRSRKTEELRTRGLSQVRCPSLLDNRVAPWREGHSMCLRCDGYSEDDVLRAIDLNIRVHGFHITSVTARRPWTYTVGVSESKGHPELVVTDMEMAAAGRLLWWVYDRIDARGGIDPAVLAASGVGLARVDHRHLTSAWFGDWCRRFGRLPRVGEFLQVHPPPGSFCTVHGQTYRRLDRPRGAAESRR